MLALHRVNSRLSLVSLQGSAGDQVPVPDDQPSEAILPAVELAVRHAIEQLIPLELRLDEVEDVPIWGNGRCMIHAMRAHQARATGRQLTGLEKVAQPAGFRGSVYCAASRRPSGI